MTKNENEKDSLFNPIFKSYLNIDEYKWDKKAKARLQHHSYQIPHQVLPVITKVTAKKRVALEFDKDQLKTKTRFIAALLLRNELLGCKQEAGGPEHLLRIFRKYYKKTLTAQQSRNYIDRLTMYRTKYNKGTLYVGMTMPPLFSFTWNNKGYIKHQKYHSEMLTFIEARDRCKLHQFADPRFFNSATLESMRTDPKFHLWHVPSNPEVTTLEAELGKPLYNSIQFPSGYEKPRNVK